MVSKVERHGVLDDLALSLAVEAGDFVYCSFCVGNVGQEVEAQVHGALDDLARRLEGLGLGLRDVVKVDALFRDIWDIPVMEHVFRAQFDGAYPARKSIQTEFAHVGGAEGLQFQLDAIAYRGKQPT
jgi:enamine deaminase RidA (YjgF/YER057c/UK114 family)